MQWRAKRVRGGQSASAGALSFGDRPIRTAFGTSATFTRRGFMSGAGPFSDIARLLACVRRLTHFQGSEFSAVALMPPN